MRPTPQARSFALLLLGIVASVAAKAQRYRNFAGTLADVRIHNRALNPEEIAALPPAGQRP